MVFIIKNGRDVEVRTDSISIQSDGGGGVMHLICQSLDEIPCRQRIFAYMYGRPSNWILGA